uniref:Uncharacterized protein n=1 Tax=Anguilla anguilla TaxID=7936 RepID=A0A0E9VC47_ANGAN
MAISINILLVGLRWLNSVRLVIFISLT